MATFIFTERTEELLRDDDKKDEVIKQEEEEEIKKELEDKRIYELEEVEIPKGIIEYIKLHYPEYIYLICAGETISVLPCSAYLVDANDDGINEIIVVLGVSFKNYEYVIFEKDDGGWNKIGDFIAGPGALVIAKEKTNGYRDIKTYIVIGAGSGIEEVYSWNEHARFYNKVLSREITY